MALSTIDTSSISGLGYGFKNRIINGGMVIDQRNAGASVTPTAAETYTLDRWCAFTSQASKFSVQQNAGSVTPPTGYKNYLGVTSLTAFSLGASDYCLIGQRVEGLNVADLGWGAAGAATVTLSFWVRSSLTGTFGATLSNNTNYSYPFTYTINSANTWEQKTVTVIGPTAGTWVTSNATGLTIVFSLGAGSTVSGAAGSWTGTNYLGVTGQTNMVSTNASIWYVTGVQLEAGTVATSFDWRPYGTELALCQRYYEMYPSMAYRNSNGTILGSGSSILGYMLGNLIGFSGGTGTQAYTGISYKVEKRATPTVTFSTRGTAYTNQVETRGGNAVYATLDKTTGGFYVGATQLAGGADCYVAFGYESSAEL